MILAVDVGNTNIVLGAMEGKEVLFTERLSTDRSKTELEYAILFRTALELHGRQASDIDGAIIGSVVPQVNRMLAAAIRKISGVRARIVGPGIRTGLNIRMDDPTEVGADLIAGAVGAAAVYPCPLIVIDMGTATTLTVVDANGDFTGGMILPGMLVSLQSLISEAAMLQGISLEVPKRVVGRNTTEAIRSGILNGQAAMMDGLIDRITAELGTDATVVATGGLAKAVIPNCRHEIHQDDDLVLRGLGLIYEKNR